MSHCFPTNVWYAAAWDTEVRQALLPRMICGKHVMMYRRATGEVTALEDACWHRLVPLSKGAP
ncbi:phenylpropionate dioxygenase-like ring-hydroxylating dioxygenase large terminal subunit [Bradyrhizobium sp. USDA 4473]